MSTLVIGETDWPTEKGLCCLSLADLNRRGLMLCRDGKLKFHDASGEWHEVDHVLWRAQGPRDAKLQHSALSLVAASSAECVNSASSLLQYGTRILNHGALRKGGLPVITSCPILGSNGLSYFYKAEFPSVLKVGDWHMGYGKCKVSNLEAWNDAVDMAAIADEIVSVEPFIDYRRDLRVLLVGEDLIAVERFPASHQWKANVCPSEIKRVELLPELAHMTRKAAALLGMSILGVDWIEDKKGAWHLLEVNPSPGLQMEEMDCRPLALKLLQRNSH